MARVTVEDCIDKVDNRFELVLLASHRARMISSGAPLTPLPMVKNDSAPSNKDTPTQAAAARQSARPHRTRESSPGSPANRARMRCSKA